MLSWSWNANMKLGQVILPTQYKTSIYISDKNLFIESPIISHATHTNTKEKKETTTLNKMKHGSHPHELHALPNMENNNTQNLTCFGCKLPLFGTCYACTTCNFYLHKLCFELPQSSLLEFIHPQHALRLVYPPHAQGTNCVGCGESCSGFTYTCNLCNFNVHANCGALLQPDPQNNREQYVTVYLAQIMLEMRSLKSQLECVSGTKQNPQNAASYEQEKARIKNMEMEEELRRRRHNLSMQQLKRASDSIDFMGQIGSSSNYTYKYYWLNKRSTWSSTFYWFRMFSWFKFMLLFGLFFLLLYFVWINCSCTCVHRSCMFFNLVFLLINLINCVFFQFFIF